MEKDFNLDEAASKGAQKFYDLTSDQARMQMTGLILICHLSIENEIDNILTQANQLTFDFKDLNLSFSKKLMLLKKTIDFLIPSEGTNDPMKTVIHMIRKISEVRNRFAHDYDLSKLDEELFTELAKLYKTAPRAQLDKKTSNLDLLKSASGYCTGFLKAYQCIIPMAKLVRTVKKTRDF